MHADTLIPHTHTNRMRTLTLYTAATIYFISCCLVTLPLPMCTIYIYSTLPICTVLSQLPGTPAHRLGNGAPYI